MQARIYLQPDALPTQDMIITANRLFRHFKKEVTFLNDESKEDLTMNRLRWALLSNERDLAAAAELSPNLVADLPQLRATSEELKADFELCEQALRLLLIDKDEKIEELLKDRKN